MPFSLPLPLPAAVFLDVFALFLPIWAIGFAFQVAYQRRLRLLAPELAARLYPGRAERSVRAGFSALGYMLRGEFRALNDPPLARLGQLYRGFFVLTIVMLATLIAAGNAIQ